MCLALVFFDDFQTVSNESQSVKMTSGQFGEIGFSAITRENDANLKC